MVKKTTQSGAVLVIIVWILAILVLLAISVGRRTSIELRLVRYHLDRIQAFYLAKAGLERIYREKLNDKDTAIDTLDEPWSNKIKSNKEPEFKDFALGNGKFAVQYDYYETKDKKQTFYGMQDEQSKLNINKIIENSETQVINKRAGEFKKLLDSVLEGSAADSDSLVDTFIDWIDNDQDKRPQGKEAYEKSVTPKNAPLNRLEELLMIDGYTPAMIEQLERYITIYGDGLINVNTASQEVLEAVGFNENTLKAEDIMASRGDGVYVREIKSSDTPSALGTDGILYIKSGADIDTSRLSVKSSVFKARSIGTVNNVIKKITTVIKIDSEALAQQLYWYED